MNENLFNAAILNEEGIIENIVVFDNEETMKEFNAVRLAYGQRIGDKYIVPEVYEIARQKRILNDIIDFGISQV